MSIILNSSIKQKANAVIVFMSFALSFSACGGDSSSSSNEFDENDGREVATVVDMGRCTSEREGDTVYVAEKMKDYLCRNRSWVDVNEFSDIELSQSSSSVNKFSQSSSSVVSNKTSAASGKSSSSNVASNISSATSNTSTTSSSSNKNDSPQTFIRENISVTGVAQKGPFKFGSPLNLYELKNDLNQSGRVYKDEINSNKGDFVIPKVSLVYPYAKLEVRGLYRNEVTGEWSKDSMTLRTLTDFSDKRTGTNLNDRVQVNINLLTHLEYDRVLYLVQNKGYSVFAAKKQAAQEIMTAFEFATAVTYSEDFAIFQNEGVSAGTIAGNVTLLAISALVMGNRSDAGIQSFIDKFREDIKTDGEWNDLQTKANMADWAYNFDYTKIRTSVKSWNILDIPDYETYLDVFWNNVYGLGGCSEARKGVVASNSNKLSKYYNEYFICKLNNSKYSWKRATTFEKDTYLWTDGKNAGFKKGNVTDTIYLYKNNEWVVVERETTIGLCGKSNAGVVSKFDNVYYICRNDVWGEAIELEYDTYGKSCLKDGLIVTGNVVASNKYVCDADSFRVAQNLEISLDKGCVSYTEGTEIRKNLSKTRDSVYLCHSSLWNATTEFIGKYGSLTDTRDNRTYKTIDIDTQTWMAENLDYNTANSYCYRDSSVYCTKYGRLYSWAAAIDSAGTWSTSGKGCGYQSKCKITGTVRGVCPTGWHLPSFTEWKTLIIAVGGDSIAGFKLKAKNGWNDFNGNNGGGSDDYLFSALPAGWIKIEDFYSLGEGSVAAFWTSSDGCDGCNSATAIYRMMNYHTDEADWSTNFKNNALSVRCIKDSN